MNRIASLLAIFTLAGYVVLYTPLKRKTALCTLVGAIPGAMPPLIGWAAASGTFYGTRLALYRSNTVARQLLTASVVYLPCLFLLMLFDKK